MTDILKDVFHTYVPSRTITIRQFDQPWTNSYTRLLLRKNNRNYNFFKKANNKYLFTLSKPGSHPDTGSVFLNKKQACFLKACESANNSKNANKRAKNNFFQHCQCNNE